MKSGYAPTTDLTGDRRIDTLPAEDFALNLLELSLAVCASWPLIPSRPSPKDALPTSPACSDTEDASTEILQEFARKAQQDGLLRKLLHRCAAMCAHMLSHGI